MALSAGEIEATLRLRDELTAKLRAAGVGVESFQAKWNKVGTSIQSAGTAIAPFSLAIGGLGTVAATTFASFERGMNKVKAVSGATADEFAKLEHQAKELGRTTQFTARDAADAMGFLAMAGMRTNDILGAMPNVLTLAASAQLDMARAADITTNILSGYGLAVEELGHANDVLVGAFTNANTNLEQLGQAFKYAGPIAKSAGMSFEETAATLSMMGNAGIQASMAGTSLRGAITRLLDPSKEATEVMERLGIHVTDSNGRLIAFSDIIRQLEPHAERTGDIMTIFGQRAGPAMSALVSQGADSLDALKSKLSDVDGIAKKISDTQMEGLYGAYLELESATEGLLIAIGDRLAPVLEDVAGKMTEWAQTIQTDLLPEFDKLSESTKTASFAILGMVAAAGPALILLGSGVRALAFSIGGIQMAVDVAVKALQWLSRTTIATRVGVALLDAGIGTLMSSLGRLSLVVAPLALAYAIVTRSMEHYKNEAASAEQKTKDLMNATIRANNAMQGTGRFGLVSSHGTTSAPQAPQSVLQSLISGKTPLSAGSLFAPRATGSATRSSTAPVVNGVAGGGDGAPSALSEAMDAIASRFTNAKVEAQAWFNTFRSNFARQPQVIQEDFYEALKNVVDMFGSLEAAGLGSMSSVFNALRKSVGDIKQQTDSLWEMARSTDVKIGKGDMLTKLFNPMLDKDLIWPVGKGRISSMPGFIAPGELKPGKTMAEKMFGGMNAGQFGSGLSQTMLSALTGGGNVGQAVGGFVGGSFGKGIAESSSAFLTKNLGGMLGGAIGSVIPGLGTLIGSLGGKLLSKAFTPIANLFGREGRLTNDLKDGIMESLGGLKGAHKIIADNFNDASLMAAFERFYKSSTRKEAEHEFELFNERLDQIKARTAALSDKFDDLSGAVSAFGGVAPAALQPTIDELLGMTGLTAEMRQQLEGMSGDPSWESMEAAAGRLGVSLEAMGEKFRQAKLTDTAFAFLHDLQLLERGGADMNAVLEQSAGKINEMVKTAMEGGLELPESLRPYIEKMIELGLLTGPNGELVKNIDQLSFADIEDSALETIKTLLEQIRDILRNDIPAAAAAAGTALDGLPDGGGTPETAPNPQYDANGVPFAGGSRGIRNFGKGTRAVLHGHEEVLTAAQGRGVAAMVAEALAGGVSGGGGSPIIVNVDASGAVFSDDASMDRLSEKIARRLPAVLERNRTVSVRRGSA